MTTDSGRKKRFVVMFILTFLYMIGELFVGIKFNCMSLIADAFHMLSDVIALMVGFISISLSPKAWKKSTFGWARAEVLGALINGVFLLALCFSVLIRVIESLIAPRAMEEPLWVLIVGAGGLLMNLVGLVIFHEGHGHSHGSKTQPQPPGHGHSPPPAKSGTRHRCILQHQGRLTRMVVPQNSNSLPGLGFNSTTVTPTESRASISIPVEEPPLTSVAVERNTPKAQSHPEEKHKSKGNMNMKGVYLHLLADTLGSVVVVVVAGVVWLTEKKRRAAQVKGKDVMPWKLIDYLDPVLTLIMLILISISTVPLVQEASLVLLQSTPAHINVQKLKKRLLNEVDGVTGIHEFHVWQLAGDRVVGSIHIRCRDITQYQQVARNVKEFFHHNGIHSVTVQAEFEDDPQPAYGPQREKYGEDCLLTCPPAPGSSQLSCVASTCCQTEAPPK